MEKSTNRIFAVSVFGYDKDTEKPINILTFVTVPNGRFVNNFKVLSVMADQYPDMMLLHISSVIEFDNDDDMIDYMRDASETSVRGDAGVLYKDPTSSETYFSITQRMHQLFESAFAPVCQHCGEMLDEDDEHSPYCSDICRFKSGH